MKKLILGIIFGLTSSVIFGMEEPSEKQAHFFSQLYPELQLYVIEQGIIARLNSNPDPTEAILDAFQYLINITATNKFLFSQRFQLKNKLIDWAKVKFVPEYATFSKDKLNEELNEAMNILSDSCDAGLFMTEALDDIRKQISENKSPKRNEIAKLIIAGADPNLDVTVINFNTSDKKGLLQQIIEFQDINLAKLLIVYGANVNRFDYNGNTPLDVAIHGYFHYSDLTKVKQMIEFLIKHGAKVNLMKDGRNRNLSRVLSYNNPQLKEILEVLLANGLQVSSADIEYLKSMRKYGGFSDALKALKELGYEI